MKTVTTHRSGTGTISGAGIIVGIVCAVFSHSGFAQTTFTAVTEGPLVTEVRRTSGCAWGDYDNDGWLDLFVSGLYETGNFLYRNNRDGTFSKIVDTPVTDETGLSLPCVWADYDNDGDLDLFLGNLDGANCLYRNNGLGNFTREGDGDRLQTGGSVLAGRAVTSGAAWADCDNDGLLDLFVANGALTSNQPDGLHRNLGNGTFTDKPARIGVERLQSIAGAWADVENDGDIDLFVTHFDQPNHLYLNRGDGTFQTIKAGHVLNAVHSSTAAAWGDYDNDGDFDLCVVTEPRNRAGQIMLYRNLGETKFEKITSTVLSDARGSFINAGWADYDNDGWLDLFVTSSRHIEPGGGENLLFRNDAAGNFTNIRSLPGGASASSGSFAWGDYNNDGFVDLFVSNGVREAQANFLYKNNGNKNKWLKLRLRGTRSNRSAVGAKVHVLASINDAPVWQLRQVTAGEGWASQSPLEISVGLGSAREAERIRVEWPSGVVQELERVPPNQILTVTEPAKVSWKRQPDGSSRIAIHTGPSISHRLEASNDLISWTPFDAKPVGESERIVSFSSGAQTDSVRFFRSAFSAVAVRADFIPTTATEPLALPEGIAVDPAGNVYVSMANTGEIRKITPDGTVSSFVRLQSIVAGMDIDSGGNLFVAVTPQGPAAGEPGIWKVTPNGDAQLFASMRPGALLNDVVVAPGGELFVSDSTGGAILRVSSDGSVTTWAQHELLRGLPNPLPPHPPFPIGANGLAFANGNAYVANTDRGQLIRIPIADDGSAGTPVVFVGDALLSGADGLVADSLGNLYIANIVFNQVLRVSPSGAITVLADARDGLDGPSSLRFGKRIGEEADLLFVNYAFISAVTGGTPKPSIMELHADFAGASVQ